METSKMSQPKVSLKIEEHGVSSPALKVKPKWRMKTEARGFIAEWAVTILILLFSTTTLAQPFVIPSGSMEDTLLIGDHVLVDKLAYAPAGSISKHLLPYQEPQYGDVIVFRYPPDLSQTLVKRLIGMPGDRLRMVNQQLYRNGQKLIEPYVYHKRQPDPYAVSFPQNPALAPFRQGFDMLTNHVVNGEIVVPAGHYFAMGDNRDNSSDSRFWGFVPRENIIGKPIFVYWSYDAPGEHILGATPEAWRDHMIDIATHFFTRTRWDRTFKLIRPYREAQSTGNTNGAS